VEQLSPLLIVGHGIPHGIYISQCIYCTTDLLPVKWQFQLPKATGRPGSVIARLRHSP
jgi:hypothetical protein